MSRNGPFPLIFASTTMWFVGSITNGTTAFFAAAFAAFAGPPAGRSWPAPTAAATATATTPIAARRRRRPFAPAPTGMFADASMAQSPSPALTVMI